MMPSKDGLSRNDIEYLGEKMKNIKERKEKRKIYWPRSYKLLFYE